MNRLSRLLLPSLVLLSLCACRPAQQAPAAIPAPADVDRTAPVVPSPVPALARPAVPALVVQTFDGKTFDLAQHRGKWVVVNFWATWCNPCLKEIPDLDALDRARDNVEVIGLAYEEIERADMLAFLKEHPISYPIAVIDVYKPPADFEIPKGLPMTYLIAPDGTVAHQFLGPVATTELASIIDATPSTSATSSAPVAPSAPAAPSTAAAPAPRT